MAERVLNYSTSRGPRLALTLSKAFSEVFKFKVHRVEHYHMLCELVYYVDGVFSRKQLNDALFRTPLQNDPKLVTSLLYEANGLYLDRKSDGDKATLKDKIELRRLSDKLIEFASAFIDGFGMQKINDPANLLSIGVNLFTFQKLKVNPAWNSFVDSLATIIILPNGGADNFRIAVRESSAHWLILHGVLAMHLEMWENSQTWTSSDIMNYIAGEAQTSINRNPMARAIRYLASHGVLHEQKRGREKLYSISESYGDHFSIHANNLSTLFDGMKIAIEAKT